MRWHSRVLALFLAVVGLSFVVPAEASSYAEDRARIEDLQARYMFALDWRDADAYAACYTEDGVFDWAQGVERGRPAIHAAVLAMRAADARRASLDKPGLRPSRMRHVITNAVLKINGNTARGRAYWIELNDNNEERKATVGAYGYYEDELVKEHGEWLFKKRTIYNEQIATRTGPAELPAW
jgi:3-phenylpropionate/cinnamic acid dioxygenase small subunit